LTIIATGSEVEIALDAAKQLADKNVRVVSMTCRELFEKQNKTYRDRIIDPDCKRRLVVEAGTPFGWDKYAGAKGAMLTLDTFGASGAYKDLAKHFGFTTENVLAKARELLAL
ncbi:MAG: transketolase C-terminal domain-containing protein, partial [Kiritimatiellae bacterium]|nr:transketolase C-terminal domain-containing protein [Kiritimatiellia bacterium]